MKSVALLKPFFVLFLVFAMVSLACGSSSTSEVKAPAVSEPENTTATNTPVVEEAPVGSSRLNPAPVGSEVTADDMAVLITEIVRPADSIVAQGNMFNSTPEAGKEYLFVKLKITCQKAASEKCSIFQGNYKLVTTSGNVVDAEWIVSGVSGMLESNELFGGASSEGYLAFIVDKTDTSPVLMYEPFLGDPFYLKIQ